MPILKLSTISKLLIAKYNKYKVHFKTGIFFIGSVSFTTIVNIVAGFLVLRWVGPEEMGVWQLLIMINTYAVIGNLGITTGLSREFPFLLGKNRNETAIELAATTKAYTFFCLIATLFIWIVLLGYFVLQGKPTNYLLTFTTVMLMLAISFYKDYVLTLFRTNTAFNKLSKSFLFQGIIAILLLPIIFLFKYQGYLFYNILTSVFSLGLLIMINPVKVTGTFKRANFVLLFKTGMPIYLMGYLYGVSKTFIKFSILYYGGILLLGIFAPVFAIRNGISILPKSVAQFIYPKFSFKIGATNNPALLWKPVKSISLLLLISFGILIIPIFYYMPEIITAFFPKYTDSIFPCKMALLSGVIYSSFIGIASLNSVKGYRERLIITSAYIILSAVLPFFVPYFFSNKIEGIAWAIFLIDLFYFILAYFITRSKLLKSTDNIDYLQNDNN